MSYTLSEETVQELLDLARKVVLTANRVSLPNPQFPLTAAEQRRVLSNSLGSEAASILRLTEVQAIPVTGTRRQHVAAVLDETAAGDAIRGVGLGAP